MTLDVSTGQPVTLDALGPVVVNSDGSLSRISNWDRMEESEKAVATRRIAKRNVERLRAFRDAGDLKAELVSALKINSAESEQGNEAESVATASLAAAPAEITQLLDRHTSDATWRSHLSATEYRVLRTKGTEARGGEYDAFYPDEGHFVCRGCGLPLYSAAAKFKSGCGWPAFDQCYRGAVETTEDNSHGMRRIEITCSRCDGHLGHVFVGETMTATNERHCVNSVSVKYVKGRHEATEEAVAAAK